ncbi:MAG: ammonium transporter [Pseudomonadota bacterium]
MKTTIRKLRDTAALAGASMFAAGAALAQEAAEAAAEAAPAAPELSAGDTAWMLTASILVLMMLVPGLALFYGGLVRKKNVLAVLMQAMFGAGLMFTLWVVAGYSLAFTEGNAFIGGLDKLMLAGIAPDGLSGTIPEFVFVMFQGTFAMLTPVIILGGPADRMKYSSAMVFLTLWLFLVYVPVCHMVWGPGGMMLDDGVLDFAGGTVVHINSGLAGLIAAILVGKRAGIGNENMAPHNLVLTMVGAALLWVGWFGFNAGSALTAGATAGLAMINTQITTAAAVVSWSVAEWIIRGKPSLLGAASGAVAGLVVITPACAFVSPSGALVMGLLAGPICYWGVSGLKKAFGYDDALDAFGVHGVGGIAGALLTGVFASEAVGGKAGLLDGNVNQLLLQAEGVLVTIAWCGVVTLVLLKVIDMTMGLRVSKEVETEGLDLALHGETVHS